MIPLSDIPELFVSDPQAGLQAIIEHLPPGATAKTLPRLDEMGWNTTITVPVSEHTTMHYNVGFDPPDERGAPLKVGEYDTGKKRAIRRWLFDLTNVVRAHQGMPELAFDEPNRAKNITAALQTAVAKPPEEARPKTNVDAFVARVIARQQSA